jgi:hypothetical protein
MNELDFVVPPVEAVPQQLSPKEASSKAFYAASTSSADPVVDYQTAKADLEFSGTSAFVEMAQQAWMKEQDQDVRGALESIISNQTIPLDEKKAILTTYAATGFLEPDLKEKYIQQTASKQIGQTQADVETQDAIINTLEQRRAKQQASEVVARSKEFTSTVLDGATKATIRQSLEGGAAALSDVLVAIPAGIGKVYSLLKDKDVAKANQLQEKIKEWAFDPDDAGSQKKRQAILEFLAPLGAFNQRIFEQEKAAALKAGASPATAELDAMASSIVEDPLSWIGIGSLVNRAGPKQLMEIPADAPASVTHMANPQVAEKAAAGAVVDKSGKFAEALGADKGTIVHDWVLSKPIPDAEQKMRPDLVEELNRMDAEIRGVFQDYRYDPNLMNATKREEEVGRVWETIRESRGPKYQQANSTILETDNVFEGKAIYGRNSSSGYLRETDATKAKDNLIKSLERLPEAYRGTVGVIKEGSEYVIQHTWKKEFDELGANVFGPDAIKTSMFGVDVSALARSSLGKWLFPTGWAPQWVEQGAGRDISRTAVIERKFVRELQDKVSLLAKEYGKEMYQIIDEASNIGKDYFSPKELSTKFPYLAAHKVDELFAAHTYWRRMQEYNYNFFNRLERNRLSSQGMQGLFDENDNFFGPATKGVTPTEIDKIRSVWNMDSQNALDYTPQLKLRQDKTLVRLDSPIIIETGERFNYALVGSKHNLGILPTETLPRTPGYSPRRVKENWYVDIIPKQLKVDGNDIKQPKELETYTLTKAADRTEAGARKAAVEIQQMYPDHTVKVRPERQDNFGQIVTDYKVHNELYRHSMKRGDRLPSSTGLANIEDYLLSELNTVKTLSRLEAFKSWDETFQRAFVKEYGEAFLPKHQFPRLKTDIVPRENMDRGQKKQFDSAQRLFDFYARQKNFETLGDFLWKKALFYVADIFEKVKIPSELFRDVGRAGNPLMNAKKVVTLAYIHLFPTRQWLVQPIQMAEIVAINPIHGVRNLTLLPMILMDLGANAKMLKGFKDSVTYLTDKMSTAAHKLDNVSPTEYRQIVDAVKQSGIVQSVDMNSIIHGVFRNAEEAFVPTTWEKSVAAIAKYSGASLLKKGTQISRNVGFDAAEITNQIGIWLQTRSQWIDDNPGKKWNTKETIETISHESWRRAGNMTRAGNLPYQEGALSIFFQFAAITQKLLMNLLQDTATTMSPAQRAKLTALRVGAYGVKYGLPGGALVYHFIDNEADETTKEVMNQDVIRRGLIDYAANKTIGALVYPDDAPDLAVTKSLSPYSEAFLPMLDVIHASWLMLDDDPVSKARIPMIGFTSSFGKAIDDMQGWWITREVNEDSFKLMAFEAAELASGFNSYWQGQLMLGMQDKVYRMGNKQGLDVTKQEAYAKMFFGVPTQKEEDLINISKNEWDQKKQIDNMAKDIHAQLMNQRNKVGEEGYDIYAKRLNSFISLLDEKHFNQQDKYKIMEEIIKKDRYSFQTTRESVFASYWARFSDQMTNDRQMTLDILKRSNLPKAQDLADKLEKGEL